MTYVTGHTRCIEDTLVGPWRCVGRSLVYHICHVVHSLHTNIEDTLMGESARDQPLQDSGFSHVL